MAETVQGHPIAPLDSDWLREHPLPTPETDADKNARGRVLLVGGCATVPGGVLLTAEGALRAGAGKVQIAAPACIAVPLGIAMPESAVFAINQDDPGGWAGASAELAQLGTRSDAIIVGPAMDDGAGDAVDCILAHCSATPIILDAAALMDLPARADSVSRHAGGAILTPHIGEMAALLDCDAADIDADRAAAVRQAAARYGAVVTLKGATSLIADRDGTLFAYAGGGVGLATGGSGDVMAGIIAGLAARGAPPLVAALWGVWLHGEAGRRCAVEIGPLGFLARELLGHIPGLMKII